MSEAHIEGPQGCKKSDLDGVISLVDAVMREGSEQSMLTDYPLVYRDGNLENISIMKADDVVVSVVPFIPRPMAIRGVELTVGIISPTATHPEHRRKGYGLACLRRGVQRMSRSGVELSALWTLVPTFRFYENADYQAVRCCEPVYRCGPGDAGLFRHHGERLVPYDRRSIRYLESIRALYETEPVRTLRSSEEYPFIFSLPGIRTTIALKNGEPTAYLTVSEAANRPGIVEAAGDRNGIETLMNAALSTLPGEVRVRDCMAGTALGAILEEALPGRRESGDSNMMVRINHASAVLRKLSNAEGRGGSVTVSIAVTDAGELVAVETPAPAAAAHAGGVEAATQLAMSRRELTSVVFGAHPERPVEPPRQLRGLFPVDLPIRPLDRS